MQQFKPPLQRGVPRQPRSRIPGPRKFRRGDSGLQPGDRARPELCQGEGRDSAQYKILLSFERYAHLQCADFQRSALPKRLVVSFSISEERCTFESAVKLVNVLCFGENFGCNHVRGNKASVFSVSFVHQFVSKPHPSSHASRNVAALSLLGFSNIKILTSSFVISANHAGCFTSKATLAG